MRRAFGLSLSLIALVSFIASFSASETTTAKGGGRAQSTPNVFKLEELTYPDITALDRRKTMFLLPVGAVENTVLTCRSAPTHLV